MSFSPPPKLPGAFPRSATPSPQKQQAPPLFPDDMPPLPSLPMPGGFHIDQPAAVPATSQTDPVKTAFAAYGQADRTSAGPVQTQPAIPAEGYVDQHSMAFPAERHNDHSAAAIPALPHMDQETGFGSGFEQQVAERVDSPFDQSRIQHKADSEASNENPSASDQFDEPDSCVTALPPMEESSDRLCLLQESSVPPVDLEKDPARPTSFKRFIRFGRDKLGAHKELSHASTARSSIGSTTSDAEADRTSKSRRVITSVGGGLRALKLMNRSAVVVERGSESGSSSNLLVNKASWHSFEGFKKRSASAVEVASEHADKDGQFDKPPWLEFPLPPGAQVDDPDSMRIRATLTGKEEEQVDDPRQMSIRAALAEKEEEQENIRVAVEETNPPDIDPVDWSTPALYKARRRSQRAVNRGKSAGESSPDSITTVVRHRRRRPYKKPVRRSSSTETVIRHPVPAASRTADKEQTECEPSVAAAPSTPRTAGLDGDDSNRASNRSVSAEARPKYSLFPSLKDPRERPPPVRLATTKRRTSIPARLPLSPALLSQPVHADGPSARSSPAASSPAGPASFSRRASTNAEHRAARLQSRNFSRPFAIAGHEAVVYRGHSQENISEEGGVGLAITEGVSTVKQQSAASTAGRPLTLSDDVPNEWPLRAFPTNKALPALPEKDQ